MKRSSAAWLAAALVLGAAPGVAAQSPPPGNTCGNENTNPQILSVDVVSPAALVQGNAPPYWDPIRGRWSRNGIEYVSGIQVAMNLVTDRCTYVESVRLNDRLLTETYVDGYWFSALPASPQPANPAQYGHGLTVFFPNWGDGRTDIVTVRVGRTGLPSPNPRVTEHVFPLVHVQSVHPIDTAAPITYSSAEMFNMFGRALYAKFNGAQNSTTLVSSDGSTWRIYGYDPQSLGVSIGPNGVAFQFKFKVDINNWCDPTVRAHGTFKLDARPSGIGVIWVNPAQGSITWPGACQAVEVVPILGLIPGLVYDVFNLEGQTSDGVLRTVEGSILTSLPSAGSGLSFVVGSSTHTNELRVNVSMPVPSVTIRAPYDNFDMNRSAILLGAADVVTMVASEVGMTDSAAGVTPATLLRSGPNGVPRSGTTSWPNPRAVERAGRLLTDPEPVGRLLARYASGDAPSLEKTYHYTPGCNVEASTDPVPGGRAWLRLGVNETDADAQRLRAATALGYSVRLFLSDQGGLLQERGRTCGSSSPTLLWRNATGPMEAWVMDRGAVVAARNFGPIDDAWQIRGAGDFDGDRRTDILWRDPSGQVSVWFMAGTRIRGSALFGGVDPGLTWTVQDVGDFDGDGRDDILWRHVGGQLAVWFKGDITDAAYPGYGNTPAPVDLAWQVKGVGDFNGDGRDDIVWRHSSGQVGIWLMDGGQRIGDFYPGATDASSFWTIQGVGDFDGNGRSDILWRNAYGTLSIWLDGVMDRSVYPAYQNVPGPVDLEWRVEGVADFDDDGRADILWRHSGGQPGVWLMDGGQFRGDVYPPLRDESWRLDAVSQDSR